MKLVVCFMLATWIWWITMIITVCYGLDTVRFTTTGATKQSYTEFIEAVRGKLATQETAYTIPLLRDQENVTISERFLLVELTNHRDLLVTLALDITNGNVVAYQAGRNRSYFLMDIPADSNTILFTNSQQHALPYTGAYDDLESQAVGREQLQLGISVLEDFISVLYETRNLHQKYRQEAAGLMVCMQMISDAARIRYIEQAVRTRGFIRQGEAFIYENFLPNHAMIALENRWSALSAQIQNSNQGVFSNPVELQRSNDDRLFNIDTLTTTLIANLALMSHICRSQFSHYYDHHQNQYFIIRAVVEDGDSNSNVCDHPEPTIRISGRNGRCVDVRNRRFHDGNPVQLWPCKSKDDANQFWTLKRDGTIRSNGKCLTATGYEAGNHVMIYNCTTAETESTKWNVFENGTIINPKSSLVLSANSGARGTTLTLESNIYALGQGWLPSNNTKPFVTSIVGLNDLCLQADVETAWLADCEDNKAEQKWALYPDGSIRPDQDHNNCISFNEQRNVRISSCGLGSSDQRWVFTNQGTILNLQTGLVVDVADSDPSAKKIIVWSPHGGRNQKWIPLLL